MSRNISAVILAVAFYCSVAFSADDPGALRGKWWNFYGRAVEAANRSEWENALEDFRMAVSKRDNDQYLARSYDNNTVDYFPHREIGIIHFKQGDMDAAARELEESMKGEFSAKAAFYLNKIKRQVLSKQQIRPAAPNITILSPASGSVVNTSTVVIKGKVFGRGSVAKISINGEPFRIERARENIEFSQEVSLEDGRNELVIAAEDLMGSIARATVTVNVDRDGPAVQIFNVEQEKENGKEYLRLIGEVSDATWISALMINGQAVDANAEKNYSLNLRLERGVRARLRIEAVDPFENATLAEIDAEKEMVAFRKLQEPFMIALSTDRITGFDKKPPEVLLKSSGERRQVLSERYTVEGEAFDSHNVGRIVINKKELYAKKARKIFFSKTVVLQEGANEITVDVYDTSDNKAERTMTITRQLPAIMRTSARMSVAILPFADGKGGDIAQRAYELLIGAFADQKRFRVVERAVLENLLLDQKLTTDTIAYSDQAARIGKQLSADIIIGTDVREDSGELEFIARVISVETADVSVVKDAFSENNSVDVMKELMASLAAKIADAFPIIEGKVIKLNGKEIIIDMGIAKNVKKNMMVLLYRKDAEFKNASTGKSQGFETIKLAEGRIEVIEKDFSKVRLTDTFMPKDVQVNDLVISK